MNVWFTLGRQALGQAQVNLLTDDLRILITKATWTPNVSTDQFVSSITAGAITQRSGTLAGRSFTGRYLFANAITMSLVPAGVADLNVVLYKNTGVDGTSQLLVKWDSGTNLPVTPDGGDLTFQFSTQGVCEI